MTEAEFDKHIDETLGIRQDGKIDLKFHSADCYCDINIPLRPPAATPEERLLRLENNIEFATWGCSCTLALLDCYWLLKERRAIKASSSNG